MWKRSLNLLKNSRGRFPTYKNNLRRLPVETAKYGGGLTGRFIREVGSTLFKPTGRKINNVIDTGATLVGLFIKEMLIVGGITTGCTLLTVLGVYCVVLYKESKEEKGR